MKQPISVILIAIVTFFSWSLSVSAQQQELVRDFTEGEKKLFLETEAWGTEVLAQYNGSAEVSPGALDSAFKKWWEDSSPQRADKKKIIYGLSALFGNYIEERKEVSWKTVVDSYGADFAIVSSGGSKIFPKDIVLKRANSNQAEFGFFTSIWGVVEENPMFQNKP